MPHALRADRAARRALVPYALIAASVCLSYANAIRGSFQFDDWNVIVDEPRVATISAWWASMPGIRPLLKFSYAANHALGSGAAPFHSVNVAIHVVNAWLVFALFARAATRRVALAGALIFALHPVQTEAVTYVSGRSVSLMALFALSSALVWIEGRSVLVSAALFAAALLVKETAAVLPLALLLWCMVFSNRGHSPFSYKIARPQELKEKGECPLSPYFAVAGIAGIAAAFSPTYRQLAATSFGVRSIGTQLLTEAHAVVHLIGELVRVDRLNADPLLPVIDAWTPRAAADVAIVVAAIVAGVLSIRRRPAVAFGILWFFVWLLPTNSFIPRLDVANDRQLYVAMIGPAWLAASALGTLAEKRGRVFPLAASLVVVLGLGAATSLRNRVYEDEVAFWEDVTRKSPANERAFNNLGYAYAQASRVGEADTALRRALVLDPTDVRAAANLRLLHEGALQRATRRP
jgi:protein O-mannosyl-transferase